jgi:hypothetical protein
MSFGRHDSKQRPTGPDSARCDHGLPQAASIGLGLALAVSFLALIPSSGAAPTAARPSERLISPRFQAKHGDTAGLAGTRSTRLAVPLRAARAGDLRTFQTPPPSAQQHGIPHGIGKVAFQYQLFSSISHRESHDLSSISVPWQRTNEHNAFSISGNADTGNADGRLLFRLGVALAVAYVLFLAAWFWGTRDRRSRVGDAARS